MIFADWAETTDSHLDSNLLMTLKKVKTLNQWNAMINQIMFRRGFDTIASNFVKINLDLLFKVFDINYDIWSIF